jgi:hypothetical protein
MEAKKPENDTSKRDAVIVRWMGIVLITILIIVGIHSLFARMHHRDDLRNKCISQAYDVDGIELCTKIYPYQDKLHWLESLL